MKPSLDELLETVHVVALPLNVKFRGITTREVLLLEGPYGWTEFSPFAEYGDEEASTWLKAAIDFGWNELPELHRSSIHVNATVPAVDASEIATVLARFPGCRSAKVKVGESGQTLAEDIARVAKVRELMGPEGRIRVDANAAWNVDETEHALHALASFDLEYIEQPCATLEELHQLRQRSKYMDIPIAADESIRKASDPVEVIAAGAADILILKAQPLGGVRQVLHLASSTKLPVVISSALDTSVGIAMGVAAACALPDLDYDCGLATAALFAADVTENPLVPVNGLIEFRRPDVSEKLLADYAATPGRTAWWRERLARCYDLLEP